MASPHAELTLRNTSLTAKDGNINVSTLINHYGGSSGPDPLTLLRRQVAYGALHNSSARYDPPRCHPDTRGAVLDFIDHWARDLSKVDKPIVWLHGAAGVGKSAIAQTLTEIWAKQGLIVASFFFWRTSTERNQKAHLIPTIAYQLLDLIPNAQNHLKDTIKGGDIFHKNLETQVRCLVVEPLAQSWANSESTFKPSTTIIVVDGLDECCADLPGEGGNPNGQDHESQQAEILSALAFACTQLPFIRIFLTSRPERRIREVFAEEYFETHTLPMSLNNLTDAAHDIQLYLDCKFAEIRRRHPGLPSSWPSHDQLMRLVENSSGGFIYPSVAVRYINHQRGDPVASLEAILALRPRSESQNKKDYPLAELDALYGLVLATVLPESLPMVKIILGYLCHVPDGVQLSRRFKNEAILTECTAWGDDPIGQGRLCSNLACNSKGDDSLLLVNGYLRENWHTLPFFQKLLFLNQATLLHHLDDLHSLLDISTHPFSQADRKLRFLHATFSQYLADASRSGNFLFTPKEFHQILLDLHCQHFRQCVLRGAKGYDASALLCKIANFLPRISPTQDFQTLLWISVRPLLGWLPSCCQEEVSSASHDRPQFNNLANHKYQIFEYLKKNLSKMKLDKAEQQEAGERLKAGIEGKRYERPTGRYIWSWFSRQ